METEVTVLSNHGNIITVYNLQFWSVLHIDDEHPKSSTPIHGCHFAPVLQQKPHLAWFSFCQCQVCTQQRTSTQYYGAWKCAVEGSVPLRVDWQGTMLRSAAEFCVCGSRFRVGDFSVKGTPPTKAFCLIHSSSLNKQTSLLSQHIPSTVAGLFVLDCVLCRLFF